MKNHGCRKTAGFVIVITAVMSLWCTGVSAQELSNLSVEYGAVCEAVVDREVKAASSSFASGIEKLYCFTRISGAKEPTVVTHIWYYGDREQARVELAVKSSSWRTWSSKRIGAEQTGTWHVDVVDSEGRNLETYRFDIYTQQ